MCCNARREIQAEGEVADLKVQLEEARAKLEAVEEEATEQVQYTTKNRDYQRGVRAAGSSILSTLKEGV